MTNKKDMADVVRSKAETPTEAPERHEVKITSLADLPGRETSIRVLLSDDTELVFPGKALSYKRWNELGRMVSYPQPPTGGFDKMGRPIYNLQDPEYLNAKEIAGEKRMYYRLVEFLTIDIPGDNLDAQVEALSEAIEFRIMKALLQGISQEHFSGAGVSVSARAATFHGSGTVDAEGDDAA